MADRPYVFISYQRDSEAVAEEIRRHLENAGFRVWRDVENIRGTARWPVAINQALHETDRLVLLLTPQSMNSDEVFNEWFFYYSHRKPIHCLMVETCDPHYQLIPFQYLDWRQPDKPWERLITELQAPFAWPAVALKERLINAPFAPERTLPEALKALHQALLSDTPVALRDEQVEAIKRTKPADETAFRLKCYATWCGPRYQLDERFVRLTMLLDQGDEAQTRWMPQPGHKRFSDLRDVLREEPSHTLVLLGAPGAGKSTLLRRLEMDVAVDALRDGSGDHPLTFFVSLADYGLGIPDEKLPPPHKWLGRLWASRYPHLPSLDTLLHDGRMLLLLDSLNEMPHADQAQFRRRAARWRAFVHTYVRDRPGNRALFACRSLDYGGVLSTKDDPVPQMRLEPMTPEQMREYLENYAPEHADMIWDHFQDDPRQFELFRIPFLLQMLIDRVRAEGTIPRGRAETFSGFVRGLLQREVRADHPLFHNGTLLTEREIRRLRSGDAPRHPYALPDRGALIPALTTLAYTMQEHRPGEEKGLVVVEYDDALEIIGSHAEDVLTAGCAMAVLEEQEDRIRFYHQLLQEFFAARRMAADPVWELAHVEWRAGHAMPSLVETLAQIADSDPLPLLPGTGWEETAVLAAAMTAEPESFVRALMQVNLPLAGRCAAAPDVRTGEELRDEVRWALVARTGDAKADLRARIAAGLALGGLGDPRFERHSGPHGDYLMPPLVEIPGGEYPIGSDEGLYEDEAPAHTVPLEPFQIGQFPVTNAEYALFMAAGGYDNEEWWEGDAARAWRRGEGTAEGPKRQWRENRETLRRWLESGHIRRLYEQ